jgi:F0F1-type ATP synthase delta subunit
LNNQYFFLLEEFDNKKFAKFLKKNGILSIFSRNTETKASNVERVIRTIKEKLFRYLTFKKTNRYINILNYIIDGYNRTIHTRTKFAPVNVTHKNEREVFTNLYKKLNFINQNHKLNLNDIVRIAKLKKSFEKGFLTNWSEELFKISKVLRSSPFPKYLLKDLHGENIIGSFYDKELQSI